MSIWDWLRSHLARTGLRRRDREGDLERELQAHLELETEEQNECGLSREEAGYAARRAHAQLACRDGIGEDLDVAGRRELADSKHAASAASERGNPARSLAERPFLLAGHALPRSRGNRALLRCVRKQSSSGERFTMVLLSSFAIASLALAVVGIYGVISFVVAQRNQELAVRMALGASRANVLWLVLQQGLKMATIGAGIGLCGAWASQKLTSGLLFEISPRLIRSPTRLHRPACWRSPPCPARFPAHE
jgi:hypothetical protein